MTKLSVERVPFHNASSTPVEFLIGSDPNHAAEKVVVRPGETYKGFKGYTKFYKRKGLKEGPAPGAEEVLAEAQVSHVLAAEAKEEAAVAMEEAARMKAEADKAKAEAEVAIAQANAVKATAAAAGIAPATPSALPPETTPAPSAPAAATEAGDITDPIPTVSTKGKGKGKGKG